MVLYWKAYKHYNKHLHLVTISVTRVKATIMTVVDRRQQGPRAIHCWAVAKPFSSVHQDVILEILQI